MGLERVLPPGGVGGKTADQEGIGAPPGPLCRGPGEVVRDSFGCGGDHSHRPVGFSDADPLDTAARRARRGRRDLNPLGLFPP